MLSRDFRNRRTVLENELLTRVAPWWLERGLDYKGGGARSELAVDGRPAGTTDKSVLAQVHTLFTWSALYHRIGLRYEWLDAADHVYTFVLTIGRSGRWNWPDRVQANGHPRPGPASLLMDGYAIQALVEYAAATGVDEAAEAALKTYDTVAERLGIQGTHLDLPDALVGKARSLHLSAVFGTAFHDLGRYLGNAEVLEAGCYHADLILDQFCRQDRQILSDYVDLDGAELDEPVDRGVHLAPALAGLQTAMHVFADRREWARVDEAIAGLRWLVEKGWDAQCGGLFDHLDNSGRPVSAAAPKSHVPQVTAMAALWHAYERSTADWCMDWAHRIQEWSFAHFPLGEDEEWRTAVQRNGGELPRADLAAPRTMHTPFHLPRALIESIEVLTRLM